MNIQKSNGVTVIGTALRTTLDSIVSDVGELPMQVAENILTAGIQPAGPMMFVYNGLSGDRQALFDLNVALPVAPEHTAQYKNQSEVTRVEPFHYVETVLHGDIAKLDKEAYEPLFAKIHAAGLVPTGFVREIYQTFINTSHEDNVTQVQVGVKPK